MVLFLLFLRHHQQLTFLHSALPILLVEVLLSTGFIMRHVLSSFTTTTVTVSDRYGGFIRQRVNPEETLGCWVCLDGAGTELLGGAWSFTLMRLV